MIYIYLLHITVKFYFTFSKIFHHLQLDTAFFTTETITNQGLLKIVHQSLIMTKLLTRNC